MTKRTVKVEDYAVARKLLDLPTPKEGWFTRAACAVAPPQAFPNEDGIRTGERNARTKTFIRHYCGPCAVRTECIRAALDEVEPHEDIRGGLPATDTNAVWRAAKSLKSESSKKPPETAQSAVSQVEVAPVLTAQDAAAPFGTTHAEVAALADIPPRQQAYRA